MSHMGQGSIPSTGFEIRKVLARKINARLAALRDNVAAAAARAQCSRGTLHAVLRTEVSVGIVRVAALAGALDSTASYLLDFSDVYPESSYNDIEGPSVTDIRVLLARNLTYWRNRRKFVNLEALAHAAGVSKSNLYMIVKARQNTSIDQLERLGYALGINVSQLVENRAST